MKLDDAIKAHSAWKIRLRQFIDGKGEPLQSRQVGRDDACPLGAWLHGEGKALAGKPEYDAVVTKHAHFHKTAADVVRAVETGDRRRADGLMAKQGVFETASQDTVDAIMRLKRVTG